MYRVIASEFLEHSVGELIQCTLQFLCDSPMAGVGEFGLVDKVLCLLRFCAVTGEHQAVNIVAAEIQVELVESFAVVAS